MGEQSLTQIFVYSTAVVGLIVLLGLILAKKSTPFTRQAARRSTDRRRKSDSEYDEKRINDLQTERDKYRLELSVAEDALRISERDRRIALHRSDILEQTMAQKELLCTRVGMPCLIQISELDSNKPSEGKS